VRLFADWRGVLKGQLVSVKLRNALWSLVAWLANEQAQPPVVRELGRELCGCREPDRQQIRTVEALLDGFALGYSDWALWELVGRQTRSVNPLPGQLHEWRKELARRYVRIANFHAEELRPAFYRNVGANVYEAHQQFDGAAYRAFIDTTVGNLSNVLSAVVGLTIEGASKGALLARFDDWLLLEAKPQFLEARIESELATAFPGARFQIAVNEGAQS